MKKNLIIGVVCIVLLGLTLLLSRGSGEGDLTACTLEALICPDGSAVGRRGSRCEFAPCPNPASFTGVLKRGGEGYQLVVSAPSGVPGGVTYALPLELHTTNVLEELLGKQVRVLGEFIAGNIFAVTTVEEVGGGYSSPTAEVGVGESVLVGYVQVTLHGIVEDSRCPVGVTCIQAGRVVVDVTLRSDTDTERRNIVVGSPSVPFDAFRVSIVDVTPERRADDTIADDVYRITVMVERLED